MDTLKYILQGIAHEIVLFFNFIDFSWFFFVVLGTILIIIFIKNTSKSIIDLLKSLFNIIKIPIVLIGVLLILGMYIITSYLFNDTISFYFISITIISLIKDIMDFYKDINIDISVSVLLKNSIKLAKGALLLLFVRIVNIIDVWDLKRLKFIYVYFVYLLLLALLSFFKKIYIIIDEHWCRCHIKQGNYSRLKLLFLYIYATLYIKDLDVASNALFAFYNHEKTSTIKVDMKKIKILALKLKDIMTRNKIDKRLLRRIGVDNYERKIQENLKSNLVDKSISQYRNCNRAKI